MTAPRGLEREWRKLTAQARKFCPSICHLCGLPIDQRLPRTHRMSWTLDHLDPRAVYGTRTPPMSRTRPAHRACNARKGKRLPAPPRRWVL